MHPADKAASARARSDRSSETVRSITGIATSNDRLSPPLERSTLDPSALFPSTSLPSTFEIRIAHKKVELTANDEVVGDLTFLL